MVWHEYERFEVGQQAQFTVWGFRKHHLTVRWTDTTNAHRRDEKNLTKDEIVAGENPGVDFFQRMSVLADIGLVEWVPQLLESGDVEAEIIHPLAINSHETDRLENRLGIAAHEADSAMLTEGQTDWAASNGLFLVPVPRHLGRVQVIGIARLRHRPKTKMTAAWWADLRTSGEEYVLRYREFVAPAAKAEAEVP